MIQILFFLSPVIYPVSMLKYPLLQYIVVLSPIYGAVELFRYPLTGITPDAMLVTISLFSGLILLLGGLVYFKRTEHFFADLA